ncbi:uncharacterized protein LOC112874097 isoform X2 [Panicum hallii]|uniref:uncharacterized protein LOC112874097 isoform X2 n=1 Tax=Panicum hallii TaxID=206008 RepID=UPI000DF4DD03|nr:uncharacterized protein LOC112874097 isoform X2 [Panicum hallii]
MATDKSKEVLPAGGATGVDDWCKLSERIPGEVQKKQYLHQSLSSTEAWFPVIHSLCDSWCQFFNCHIREEESRKCNVLTKLLGACWCRSECELPKRCQLSPCQYALGVASSYQFSSKKKLQMTFQN